MNSTCGKLVLPAIAAIALWGVGGFVFGKAIGMICVMAGIIVLGLAAGNILNSPCPQIKNHTPQ